MAKIRHAVERVGVALISSVTALLRVALSRQATEWIGVEQTSY